MTSTLKQFKARAFARPGVEKAYDDLAEEFAFLDEVLKARAETGLTQAEVAARVGTMRRWKLYRALRAAAVVAAAKGRVRIVDVSLQGDHVHLVCEADTRMLLARGMQGFLISAARRVNRALGGGACGCVFADRYNARPLTCPTDVRNTRLYVLNNFRHHDYHHFRRAFDPLSNALNFDGWVDLDVDRLRAALPEDERWPRVRPHSWLMTTGWRRRGLLSTWEMPRS